MLIEVTVKDKDGLFVIARAMNGAVSIERSPNNTNADRFKVHLEKDTAKSLAFAIMQLLKPEEKR